MLCFEYVTTEEPKLEQIGVTDLNLRWWEQSLHLLFQTSFIFNQNLNQINVKVTNLL